MMNAKRFTNALPRSQGPSGATGNDAGMVALLKAQGLGVGRGIRDTWARPVAGNAGSGQGRAQAPGVQATAKRSGPGGAKYGNKKTVTPDGVKFDSRAEARRWGHLCMQLRAGEISELRRQVTEYAKKYDHAFDAKAKVDEMRITVNGLIHQFGVR